MTDISNKSFGGRALSELDSQQAPLLIGSMGDHEWDGSTTVNIEINIPQVIAGSNTTNGGVSVWMDGADKGLLLQLLQVQNTEQTNLHGVQAFTPASGEYEIELYGWSVGGRQSLVAPITARIYT
jgi:hypothetical protein